MQKRSHNDTLRSFDALQTRAFDVLARYYPGELIYDGKKAVVISTAIANEYVQEIVGYLPKKSASVEIKQKDLARLGCTNESYVSIDGVVLRLRQLPTDASDISIKFYAHSTPNQPAASSQESGSIALEIDQVEIPLTFRVVDPAKDYVFLVLEIENQVDTGDDLIGFEITPGARTATGRTLHLNGAINTENYVLRYTIVT